MEGVRHRPDVGAMSAPDRSSLARKDESRRAPERGARAVRGLRTGFARSSRAGRACARVERGPFPGDSSSLGEHRGAGAMCAEALRAGCPRSSHQPHCAMEHLKCGRPIWEVAVRV